MDLKDVKEANPADAAEYDVANRIDDELGFKWWVSYTLHKRNQTISKTKTKYWKKTHNFGVQLPK